MHDDIPSLTRGLARCDERAWREFHERYHDFLDGLAVARGVAPCDAPDLIQRVYLRVLRHPKVFASADAFSGWLACLVRCEAVDAARSRNRRAWLTERFQQWIEARTPEPEHPQAEQLAVAMALLIHRGFPAEDANGVALTGNLFDPTQPAYYLNVQFGDTPVVRPPSEVTTDQFLVYFDYPNQPVAWLGHSSLVPAGQTVLTTPQVQEVSAALGKIHQAFAPIYAKAGKFYAMDVEFKFNTEAGEPPHLWIKQARPHAGWQQ